MVPLSAQIKVHFETGPQNLTHYIMYRSISINGNAAPGYSSGQAMAAMAEISERVLPANKTFGFEWSGMSYQELLAGNMTIYVFLADKILRLASEYLNLANAIGKFRDMAPRSNTENN